MWPVTIRRRDAPKEATTSNTQRLNSGCTARKLNVLHRRIRTITTRSYDGSILKLSLPNSEATYARTSCRAGFPRHVLGVRSIKLWVSIDPFRPSTCRRITTHTRYLVHVAYKLGEATLTCCTNRPHFTAAVRCFELARAGDQPKTLFSIATAGSSTAFYIEGQPQQREKNEAVIKGSVETHRPRGMNASPLEDIHFTGISTVSS